MNTANKGISTAALRRIATDFGFFCRVVLHRDVHDMQLAPFIDPHRFICFVGGRGAGKSSVGQMYCVWKAFTEPKHVVVWISSAEEQSEHSGDILAEFLDDPALAGYVKERSAERVRFQNGSVIYFLPNSPRRARGFHNRWSQDYIVQAEKNLVRKLVKSRKRVPSITLVIDESAEVSEAVYTAAQGVLSTSAHSRGIYMGSAKGRDSWFYREYIDGLENEGETKSYCLSAEDCPWVDKAYLAEMKRKLDDATYRAEFCGEFMDALSAYFTPEMIANATQDYALPSEFDRDYEYVVSIDLAPSERFGSDYAVVMVLGRCFGRTHDDVYSYTNDRWLQKPTAQPIPPHIRLFYMSRFQTLDHEGLRAELHKVKQRYPTLDRGIAEAYESMQLDALVWRVKRRGQDKETLTRYGRGEIGITMEVINPVSTTQHEAFSGLHHLIREGELWLPMDGPHVSTLRQELLHLQKEVTPAGNVRWQAAKGFKDDTVYALLWGCYALRRERSWGSIPPVQFREEAY